jgi:hypothetical protein
MSEEISNEKYWQVYGLFVAARLHQSYVNDLEKQMNLLLGNDDQGHLSDLIYDYGPHPTAAQFNHALELEGFTAPSGNGGEHG